MRRAGLAAQILLKTAAIFRRKCIGAPPVIGFTSCRRHRRCQCVLQASSPAPVLESAGLDSRPLWLCSCDLKSYLDDTHNLFI
ncbi:hypothetical protein FIBSPDRAFT_868802 [Athelia psychrophila]|uniref:Uncharacterized protein n=1 Tax=Athelia psychrophila TaxID=1759441 RepID=A0A166CRP8_9AGAM|nr:hypothetical protein FIBSPDRAFT_868802 [Fibularhizoctonia sp. CBS 109695]